MRRRSTTTAKAATTRGKHARPAWEREPLRSTRQFERAHTVSVLVYHGVCSTEVELAIRGLARHAATDVWFVGSTAGVVHGVEPSRDVVVDLAITADTLVEPPTGLRSLVDDRTAGTGRGTGLRGNPLHPDILVVPGGLGWRQVVDDASVRAWLTSAAHSARAVLAISTGSLLLAACGQLEGADATGHWLADDELARLGARPTGQRVVATRHGRVATASGAHAVTAAIDEILSAAIHGDGRRTSEI